MLALKKVKFIYNPRSGLMRNPLIIRKLIEFTLHEAPFSYDFVETQHRGHARELSAQAAAQGYDAVVAVGGDGTANEVASGLLCTSCALGIIPIGSGNGLARGLSIPVSVRRATRVLLDGTVRVIDAGQIENRNFFVVTGIGFDALIGKLFDDRSLRGPLPYFYIGVREFFFYRPELFTLKFDDRTITVRALLVTIANTKQWGNGVFIAPKAEPDDGLLDICIIHRINTWRAVYHLPKLFTGKIDKVREYERYQTTSLQILRQKPGPFHVDGEPVDADNVLNISIKKRSLSVIVPTIKGSQSIAQMMLSHAKRIAQSFPALLFCVLLRYYQVFMHSTI
ncbi:diacylglycerol kinase family lipid kinase [candidate division KSB1 bacterium]|nr:diacylglycerol kinase family lipid kinase [candidate division KSB1 bacterium]